MAIFPSASPLIPKMMKGAILSIASTRVPTIVVFQYNPAEVSRTVEPRWKAPFEDAPTSVERLMGPPRETISINLTIDAATQLEYGSPIASTWGIYPQLSALELLAYPDRNYILGLTALAKTGTIEVIPPEVPLTLFIWGMWRVVPVRLTSLSITETMHNANLSPILAQVQTTLEVLSYDDFADDQKGYYLYLAYQAAKQAAAAAGSALNVVSAVGAAAGFSI